MYGHVRGILGDPGTCKTLFLTYMAYDAYMNGESIVSNYTLEFPHLKIPFDKLGHATKNTICGCMIQPETLCEHGNKLLLEDKQLFYMEMGRGADSYNFLSKKNNDISDMIFLIRHLNAILWYDAQRYTTITTRVRHLTNFFFLMEHVEADPYFVRKNPHLVGNELEKPIQKLITGKHIVKAVADVTITDDAFTPLRQFRFDGRNFVHLYNTKELMWV